MSRLIFNQLGTIPSDTDAGTSQLFLKDDGGLYLKNASNTEVALLTGADTTSVWVSGNGAGNINYTGGFVGIGATSPDTRLHIKGGAGENTYVFAENTTAANAGIKLKNTQGEWTIIANDRLRFVDDDASGTERMCINSSGKVGIGTTVPSEMLSVAGAVSATNTCKAWIIFNGEGTVAITKSYNVSSLADNGTGDYTINFSTNFSDANYCVIGGAHRKSGDGSLRMFGTYDATAMAVGSCRVNSQYSGGNSSDNNRIQLVFFSSD